MATRTIMTDTRFVLDSLVNDSIMIEHVLSVVIGTYEGKHQDDWKHLLDQIKEVNPFFSSNYLCTVSKGGTNIVAKWRVKINVQKWN